MRQFAILAILALTGCIHETDDSLIGAARLGRVDKVKEFIKQGVDLNEGAGVNAWPPLMHAIHKNQRGSVVALLEAGADPNRTGANGLTPLMMAAGYGYGDIVRDLLNRGADPKLKDGKGLTARDYAKSGVMDIDKFTYGREQKEALQALDGR